MARNRTIPDSQVFAAIQGLLDQGGEKSVSFGTVAQATGLAASSLVQRYGSLPGMLRATRNAAWDALEARTAAAIETTSGKGPQALLKALGNPDAASLASDLRGPELRARAQSWRGGLEAALAARLGGGSRAAESAALLFAAWQGQALWRRAGTSGFKLKDAVKRLG